MENNGKLRIGVIFGGRSGEHEVSLMSARSVLDALNPERYSVTQIGISHDGTWLVGDQVLDAMLQEDTRLLLRAALLPEPNRQAIYAIGTTQYGEILEKLADLDVIFPVLHGTFGEDGTLQGLLEMADLAYVGAGVLGSALGMDKSVFKDVMRANGIPVVPAITVLRSEIQQDIQKVIDRVETLGDFPLFVKPANLGSSVGITKCRSRSDLLEGLMEAARYDRRVLVEKGIQAREIEVSVLGNDEPQASVPGEILPSREFYSYEAKYLDGSSGLVIPAQVTVEVGERIRRLAVQAFRAVDCAGMARADFLLDKNSGELYLNEINTIPGFTKISMYAKLWQESGLSYPALLDRLVELAFERKTERDHTERRYRREY